MRDQRSNAFGQLMSCAWALLVCAIVLTIAVSLLREIWPWLLGVAVLATLAVIAFRLTTLRRNREW